MAYWMTEIEQWAERGKHNPSSSPITETQREVLSDMAEFRADLLILPASPHEYAIVEMSHRAVGRETVRALLEKGLVKIAEDYEDILVLTDEGRAEIDER